MPVLDPTGKIFKDARGAVLEVGDICVKGAAGDSVTLSVVQILGFKNKVKIGKRDGFYGDYRETRRKQEEFGLEPSSWAERGSLIKVTGLPEVADRLNTPKPVVSLVMPKAEPPMLHSAFENNERGQVRVYDADGKLKMGTTVAGYQSEYEKALAVAGDKES